MGAFDNLFRRLGYAKLDRYGLVLTGDDRVLATRPHILDDGFGGKIVGWADDDMAAMELDHWGKPKPAPAKRLAGKKVVQPPPRPPARTTVQTPVVTAAPAYVAPAPVIVAPPPAYVAPAPVVVAPPAPVVAAEPETEDDDWEWVIAIARARATAEETPILLTAPKRKTAPGMPAVRAKTEPQPVVRSMPKPVAPLAARKTVIPVPDIGRSPLHRIARGTGQLDDTVRTLPAPAANDDNTSPYVTLPPEVKPVGLAHTKRVAAKAR
jgi:hypothetical protein